MPRAETGPLQARLARLARTGSDAARARARDAAAALAADIAQALPDGRAEAAPTPGGSAVTVEAPGLAAREFGTATRSARPVIGPAVARLPGGA
ncbi:hypothetical protein [Methylobacterium nonmethylotrophicum]|uniref:Uncharacterized protein n=1 Tax=Methylobacterium nonmethylotrophicum TaxID=1141884 RepID=A0A4Z0NLB8_9HYPH|nr:hypothetical protein [Methylobacterium nonmethylotrophicum]TGD96473.1 hypothetical protein EU555_23760 [Methylobacterium nonmethylotrophicum]